MAKDISKAEIINHFEQIALDYDYWKKKNSYYYSLLKSLYRKNIPPGASVIEFGCATGDILASCLPAAGVGIDASKRLISLARGKYPQYEFRVGDAEEFSCADRFEYAIMCDIIEHISNIPLALENAHRVLMPSGRLVCTSINPLWGPLMGLLEKLKLKMPEGPHFFMPNRFIALFCQIKGFKIISRAAFIFVPKRIPFISGALNAIIPKVPVINRLCWVQVLIAEKIEQPKKELGYSIIIPVYNEEENIEECIRRIPKVNKDYEIIVIDDGSRDNTSLIVKKIQKGMNNLRLKELSVNKGKAFAVQEGIKLAKQDTIVILDADMTVAPEDIPLFIEPLERGIAEFVNGTRLIYKMERGAMPQIKKIGNFIFALIISNILGYKITDSLCGTKAFFRNDFRDIRLSEERWGDFVFLSTARAKGLRMIEVPVRYYARKAGKSKMFPIKDGIRFARYILKIAIKCSHK